MQAARSVFLARLLLCALVLFCVAPAAAATITYTIDTSRSQLAGSGSVRNIPFSPQTPGSLQGALSGSLVAQWHDGGLVFSGGSMLVATEHPEGPFEPSAAATGSGSTVDNFGAEGRVFGLPLLTAAVRDAVADLHAGSVEFGGPVTSLQFGFVGGTVDYHDQFNNDLDWFSLTELQPVLNAASGTFARTVENNLDVVTLPILADLTFEIFEPGDGRLMLQGQIVATSPVLTIEPGTTALIDSAQHLSVLNVEAAATAQLTSGGAKNLVAAAVNIAGGASPTGTIDVTDNALIVDYPAAGPNPVSQIRTQIISARGAVGLGATWTGQGIGSSTAAAQVAGEPESVSVAYAVNGDLPLGAYSSFRGENVDASAVLIRYTRTADANLDGVVDDEDVTIVGAAYAPGVPQASWALGDFDYNGFVDDDDITLLGALYDPMAEPIGSPAESGPALKGPMAQAVPEPASWLMLAFGGIWAGSILRWRRACKRSPRISPPIQ